MNDVELLARLIQCEAGGEGDTGMRAVASVIMNRLRTPYGEYGRYGDLRDVVFAPRQFECAMTSQPQNLYNMSPDDTHYEIAEWALAGGRLGGVGDALWFFNPYSYNCPQNFPSGVGTLYNHIGNHCFYGPTSLYYST